ncbi:MAG: GntR family transcriptional regulator [Candidatus Humimicrobiaceae bacterium]
MNDAVDLIKQFAINKDSRVPYYYQLKQYIVGEIESGRWKPGQQILPEIKICEIFDISRTVVRQTYQELVNEGYLIKKKAKGTFIAEPKISENLVQSLMGFYEDMTARGFKVKNDIIWHKKIAATPRVAEKLGLETGEEVIVIKRVRRLNDEPIVLDRTYIPYKLCPDLLNEDLTHKSLYSYIEGKYNLKIDRGRRFIEATVASEEEAKLLDVKKGSPLLYIESVSFLDNGVPLEYYIALHRGDRSRLVTELKRLKSFDEIGILPADSIVSGFLIKEHAKK